MTEWCEGTQEWYDNVRDEYYTEEDKQEYIDRDEEYIERWLENERARRRDFKKKNKIKGDEL